VLERDLDFHGQGGPLRRLGTGHERGTHWRVPLLAALLYRAMCGCRESAGARTA